MNELNAIQAADSPNRHVSLTTGVWRFMTIAGQSVTGFNPRQAIMYLGLQFEELAEKIEVMRGGTITQSAGDELLNLSTFLQAWAKRFKEGDHMGDLARSSHKDIIDADYDLAFVSVAALYSTAKDCLGAIMEGNRSNLDKFPGGVCVRDGNGKVVKPAGWEPPNFEPFVDTSVRDGES